MTEIETPTATASARGTANQPSGTRYRPGRAAVHRPTYESTIGVIDIEGLIVQGRPVTPCPMPGSLGDAYAIAAYYDVAQLWIAPRVAKLLGLPPALPGDAPVDAGMPHPWAMMCRVNVEDNAAGILTRGVIADPADRLAPWVNVYDPNNRSGTLVSIVMPHLDYRTAWGSAQSGAELLDGVIRFRRAVGSPYYWSVNVTASSIVRDTTRSLVPCAALTHGQVPPVTSYRRPIPARWSRPLLGQEDDSAALIVEFDTNAAHLAPIGSVSVGIGEPTHFESRGPIVYGPRPWPGYYRLHTAPTWPGHLATLLPPLVWEDPEQMWADASLVALLTTDLGVELDIREAYAWEHHGRPYEGFYERCRLARKMLIESRAYLPGADLAYRANASLYKSFWGYLARTSGPRVSSADPLGAKDLLWRPDHSHAIDTTSYCNMIRRVVKIGSRSGRWPVGMQNDAAYYAVQSLDDVPGGMVIGPLGGQFKAERHAPLVALRELCGEIGFVPQYRRMAERIEK